MTSSPARAALPHNDTGAAEPAQQSTANGGGGMRMRQGAKRTALSEHERTDKDSRRDFNIDADQAQPTQQQQQEQAETRGSYRAHPHHHHHHHHEIALAADISFKGSFNIADVDVWLLPLAIWMLNWTACLYEVYSFHRGQFWDIPSALVSLLVTVALIIYKKLRSRGQEFRLMIYTTHIIYVVVFLISIPFVILRTDQIDPQGTLQRGSLLEIGVMLDIFSWEICWMLLSAVKMNSTMTSVRRAVQIILSITIGTSYASSAAKGYGNFDGLAFVLYVCLLSMSYLQFRLALESNLDPTVFDPRPEPTAFFAKLRRDSLLDSAVFAGSRAVVTPTTTASSSPSSPPSSPNARQAQIQQQPAQQQQQQPPHDPSAPPSNTETQPLEDVAQQPPARVLSADNSLTHSGSTQIGEQQQRSSSTDAATAASSPNSQLAQTGVVTAANLNRLAQQPSTTSPATASATGTTAATATAAGQIPRQQQQQKQQHQEKKRKNISTKVDTAAHTNFLHQVTNQAHAAAAARPSSADAAPRRVDALPDPSLEGFDIVEHVDAEVMVSGRHHDPRYYFCGGVNWFTRLFDTSDLKLHYDNLSWDIRCIPGIFTVLVLIFFAFDFLFYALLAVSDRTQIDNGVIAAPPWSTENVPGRTILIVQLVIFTIILLALLSCLRPFNSSFRTLDHALCALLLVVVSITNYLAAQELQQSFWLVLLNTIVQHATILTLCAVVTHGSYRFLLLIFLLLHVGGLLYFHSHQAFSNSNDKKSDYSPIESFAAILSIVLAVAELQLPFRVQPLSDDLVYQIQVANTVIDGPTSTSDIVVKTAPILQLGWGVFLLTAVSLQVVLGTIQPVEGHCVIPPLDDGNTTMPTTTPSNTSLIPSSIPSTPTTTFATTVTTASTAGNNSNSSHSHGYILDNLTSCPNSIIDSHQRHEFEVTILSVGSLVLGLIYVASDLQLFKVFELSRSRKSNSERTRKFLVRLIPLLCGIAAFTLQLVLQLGIIRLLVTTQMFATCEGAAGSGLTSCRLLAYPRVAHTAAVMACVCTGVPELMLLIFAAVRFRDWLNDRASLTQKLLVKRAVQTHTLEQNALAYKAVQQFQQFHQNDQDGVSTVDRHSSRFTRASTSANIAAALYDRAIPDSVSTAEEAHRRIAGSMGAGTNATGRGSAAANSALLRSSSMLGVGGGMSSSSPSGQLTATDAALMAFPPLENIRLADRAGGTSLFGRRRNHHATGKSSSNFNSHRRKKTRRSQANLGRAPARYSTNLRDHHDPSPTGAAAADARSTPHNNLVNAAAGQQQSLTPTTSTNAQATTAATATSRGSAMGPRQHSSNSNNSLNNEYGGNDDDASCSSESDDEDMAYGDDVDDEDFDDDARSSQQQHGGSDAQLLLTRANSSGSRRATASGLSRRSTTSSGAGSASGAAVVPVPSSQGDQQQQQQPNASDDEAVHGIGDNNDSPLAGCCDGIGAAFTACLGAISSCFRALYDAFRALRTRWQYVTVMVLISSVDSIVSPYATAAIAIGSWPSPIEPEWTIHLPDPPLLRCERLYNFAAELNRTAPDTIVAFSKKHSSYVLDVLVCTDFTEQQVRDGAFGDIPGHLAHPNLVASPDGAMPGCYLPLLRKGCFDTSDEPACHRYDNTTSAASSATNKFFWDYTPFSTVAAFGVNCANTPRPTNLPHCPFRNVLLLRSTATNPLAQGVVWSVAIVGIVRVSACLYAIFVLATALCSQFLPAADAVRNYVREAILLSDHRLGKALCALAQDSALANPWVLYAWNRLTSIESLLMHNPLGLIFLAIFWHDEQFAAAEAITPAASGNDNNGAQQTDSLAAMQRAQANQQQQQQAQQQQAAAGNSDANLIAPEEINNAAGGASSSSALVGHRARWNLRNRLQSLAEARDAFLLQAAVSSLELALAVYRIDGCTLPWQLIYVTFKCGILMKILTAACVGEFAAITEIDKAAAENKKEMETEIKAHMDYEHGRPGSESANHRRDDCVGTSKGAATTQSATNAAATTTRTTTAAVSETATGAGCWCCR